MYIDDLIDAVISMMTSPADFTDPVNVGGTREISMLELAQTIKNLTNSSSDIIRAPLAMVYKLCREAEKGWRRLDGSKFIPLLEAGIKFVNGERVDDAAA